MHQHHPRTTNHPRVRLVWSRSSRMLHAFTQARRHLHPILTTVTLSPLTRTLAAVIRLVTHMSVEMSAYPYN